MSALAVSQRTVVALRTTSLGRVLVGANGHTLYLFGKDTRKSSTCYGRCATFWPPLLASGTPTAGAGVKGSLLATTKRKDGKLQVTYAGHPLYFFSEDSKAGQTKGEGFSAFGAKWYVLSAAGAKIVKPAASAGGTTTTPTGTTTTPTTTSGGGY